LGCVQFVVLTESATPIGRHPDQKVPTSLRLMHDVAFGGQTETLLCAAMAFNFRHGFLLFDGI
jgi:hypothetical protein